MNPFPYCLTACEDRDDFLDGKKFITVYLNTSEIVCVKFVDYDVKDYAVIVMSNNRWLFIAYDTAESLVKWMMSQSDLPRKIQFQEVVVTK